MIDGWLAVFCGWRFQKMFVLTWWSSLMFSRALLAMNFANACWCRVSVASGLICNTVVDGWLAGFGFEIFKKWSLMRATVSRIARSRFQTKGAGPSGLEYLFLNTYPGHTAEICTNTWRQNQHTLTARIEVGVAWFWDVSKTVPLIWKPNITDEPDTDFVRICEFMNTSFRCCGLRYSGTPVNLHVKYNGLTDKSQAAEPKKNLWRCQSRNHC